MQVKINNLDHQGRGVVHDGKTIFVENALPEEVVAIEIQKEKKNFIEAKTVNIIKPSKDRINPACIYYDTCGGCNLLHMNYKGQLVYKQSKVAEILTKFTKEDIKVNSIIYTDNQFNYRNKITVHKKQELGYYAKGSKEIVPICKCHLVDAKINQLLEYMKKYMNLALVDELIIRTSKYHDEAMVVVKTKEGINESEWVNHLKDKVTSFIVCQNNVFKTICGSSYIKESMNDFDFLISKDSFFQVNTECAIKLYDKVKEYAHLTGNENVLDLYCGTGTIGIYLSKDAKHVLGVEINKHAIEDANKNKELNHISNIDFICGDSGNVVTTLKKEFDVIIVDPPRAGLDKQTIQFLKESNARRIVYVSCDPVTLARDINILKHIYDIKELTPVDMFPNTSHVECVSVMVHR